MCYFPCNKSIFMQQVRVQWEEYQQGLNTLRRFVIMIETLLFFLRLYLLKEFSVICSFEIVQIVVLSLIGCHRRPINQCKLYIILGVFIQSIILYNLGQAFSENLSKDDFYLQNFASQFKQIAYPVELFVRVTMIAVIWRVYQFSCLKLMHSSQFQIDETDSQV